MTDITPSPTPELVATTSPVITKGTAVQMDFFEAMRKISEGLIVSRLSWDSNEEYCLMKTGLLHIHTKGALHQWLISDGDMSGVDWVVLPLSQ